jgi:hypothetical protein
MSRKMIVLALALVAATVAAIPVVAQERTAAPRVKALSKKATKKAQKAMREARQAKRLARRALTDAAAAQIAAGNAGKQASGAAATANEAKANAGEARATAAAVQEALGSTRIEADSAAGEVSTSSAGFVGLTGGPTVTVTVPDVGGDAGLIEVWAQATIDGDGAVSLFEDGEPVPGQAEDCSPEEGVGALFSEPDTEGPITLATPAPLGIACGTVGAPGAVLFETTPGPHTYELRYASCGCGDASDPSAFSERRLFVGPRL